MKLTFENILFINNYLENSDIRYKDIRMEMIDHVASGIETKISEGDNRDFYYIFKDYMVENKARLLHNNKQFLKSADRKIAKLLFNNLLSIPALVFFAAIFCAFYVVYSYCDYEFFKTILFAVPIITSICFGIAYFIALKVYKLDRYSVIERIAFPFIIIIHVLTSLNNILKPLVHADSILIIIVIVSLCLTMMILRFKITIGFTKTFQTRFKNVV
ncbi:hypothetical protein [Winogradskyella sp. PG-2]|uniref:hypothetical protein n=1 Tax=Winogradskyella sp. PG-2 TaxID=754409 RepID=UPI0004585C98|nr:hypothetical protein [Winogradskyella sp. PG-2]BAO75597.1 hypothetical protein WPG_1367 [Winogradskyella sp. PG-2]